MLRLIFPVTLVDNIEKEPLFDMPDITAKRETIISSGDDHMLLIALKEMAQKRTNAKTF